MTEKEQQYFEIMLEKILHEVETVAEGHSLLDEKIDRFHKEAKADHHLAMDLIKHSHDELKKELQAVDKHSKERDVELQAILTAEIRTVDKKLTSEIRKVGDKVDGHEERISFLERKAAFRPHPPHTHKDKVPGEL